MKHVHAMVLTSLLVFCLAVLASAQCSANPNGFSELHRVQLADARELEMVMGIVERPGESVSAKHYHPSSVFAFVLEGTVTVTTEGAGQRTLNVGDSFHQPAGEWHIVSTAAEGAKSLVFRVVKKGQPMIIAVE